ncbi:hypothetical protein PoB_001968800 [Plakobranchus ocellatus]|uniref:Uncharacterized protein n=1 Tax=Plakobranchus ocellatus TaxID=259542 RepID=A0AAV3ZEK8_9GAST|nr:hypothetical protein PoB_001968800 [Plakobranchus ocellatus]
MTGPHITSTIRFEMPETWKMSDLRCTVDNYKSASYLRDEDKLKMANYVTCGATEDFSRLKGTPGGATAEANTENKEDKRENVETGDISDSDSSISDSSESLHSLHRESPTTKSTSVLEYPVHRSTSTGV